MPVYSFGAFSSADLGQAAQGIAPSGTSITVTGAGDTMQVNDVDAIFDDEDAGSGQSLDADGTQALAASFDGGTYSAGQHVESVYAWTFTNTTTGETGTAHLIRIYTGGSNTTRDAQAGEYQYAFTAPVSQGDVLTFSNATYIGQAAYADLAPLGGASDYIVEGTSGDDLIVGTYAGDPDGDRIDNNDAADGSNDDRIEAGAGNDSIDGGAGADYILGEDGDDVIFLADDFGTDTIIGGERDESRGDTLDLSGTTTGVVVDLTNVDAETGRVTNGTDTASFTEIEHIVLGRGRDTVVLADGSGDDAVQSFDMADGGNGTTNDRLDVSGLTSDGGTTPVTTADVVVSDTNGDGTGDAILTFRGGESITLIGVSPAQLGTPAQLEAVGIPAAPAPATQDFVVDGTAAGEVINTGYGGDPEGDRIDNNDAADGSNDDSIRAGGGDDTIAAGFGNDTVDTGDGNDLVYAEAGDDSIIGGQGNDTLFGDDGDDTLRGGIGNDSLDGGDGRDLLSGDEGNDTLWGLDGDDTLIGGEGDDFLNGGYGSDEISGGVGDDFLEGWYGEDTIYGGDGNDFIDADIDSDLVYGGEGNDTVVGGFSVSTDTIYGEGGDDSLDGQSGDDLLYGGIGDDVLIGNFGDDTIFLEDDFGNDTIIGTQGDETTGDVLDMSAVTTATRVDLRDGNPATGTVSDGTYTANFIEIENIILGGGRDTIVLADGSGADKVIAFDMTDSGDGTTNDQLDVSGMTSDGGTTPVTTADVIVSDTNGDGTGDAILTFPYAESITLVGVLASQLDTPAELTAIGIPLGPMVSDFIVEGSAGADLIDGLYSGDPEGDMIDNSDHSNGSNDDSVVAGGGDDTVYSGAGYDTVEGGTGDDYIVAGAGNDSIYGGTGDDSIEGGDDQDTISLENDFGDDTIDGGSGGTTDFDILDAGLVTDNLFVDLSAGGAADPESGTITADNPPTAPAGQHYVRVFEPNTPAAITDFGVYPTGAIDFNDGTFHWVLVADNDAVLADSQGGQFTGQDATQSLASDLDGLGIIGSNIGAPGKTTYLDGNGNSFTTGWLTTYGPGAGTVPNKAYLIVTDAAGGDPVGTATYTGVNNPYADFTYSSFTIGGDVATFTEIEAVILGSGDDTVIGSGGNDSVSTGSGADIVNGGAGNDTFDLGTSDGAVDTVVFADGDGKDTVAGFEAPTDNGNGTFTGNDQLDVSGMTDANGNPVNVLDVTVTDTNGDGTGDAILTFPNGESITLTGVSPADVASPDALAAMGLPFGDDIISGTSGNDLIDAGYAGDPHGDAVDASDNADGNNNDVIDAGAGDDTVNSGAGDDSVDGGGGNDSLLGGDGADTLVGGTGNDTLSGGAGADVILGGDGDDLLQVGEGDTLDGGDGDDYFNIAAGTYGPGVTTIIGGEGGETAGDTLAFNGTINRSDITFTNTDPGVGGGMSGTVTLAGGMIVNFTEIEKIIICFTQGTRIATPRGAQPVEDIAIGDLVLTRDHGLQPVRWIGRRTVPALGSMAPIRFETGVLNNERPLLVSPQHRMLISCPDTVLLFGESEVLAAAKHLVNGGSVAQMNGGNVTYVHIMFDRHEVIYAEGAASESFFPGGTGLNAVEEAAREELFNLFPDLRSHVGAYGNTARLCLKSHESGLLERLI
jgi:Ca2+-binding RTX toxin-like protein